MNGVIERSVSASSTKEGTGQSLKTKGIEETGIEQMIVNLTQCWNEHDAGAFAALFEENGDFVNLAGRRAEGRSGIKSEFLALHSDITRTSVLTNPKIEVRLLAPDVAVVVTRWRLESWVASEIRHGSAIYILVKHGRQWRIRNARMAGIATSFELKLAGAA